MNTVYKVLGLMSGTSLDGLDVAYCHLWKKNNTEWDFKIVVAKTIAYTSELKSKLKNAILLSSEEHEALNKYYGQWLGEQAKEFIEKNNCQVDFISSHGHTSHHRPNEGYTFQLGDGQQLADASKEKVICDFRSLDVALGGQGAPLVPIGDELLFSDYDFCLNLGGISNVSFQKNNRRIAYDIGLANMPLNYCTQKINLEYDKGGALAASGKIDFKLYDQLNELPYYKLPYPKSTGYEWFMQEVLPLIEGCSGSTADLLHTFIHHNCVQIAVAIKSNSGANSNKVLVSGGGALNAFFIRTLKEKLASGTTLDMPSKRLINFKEALVFALMGVLCKEGQINIRSSVTGAIRDSCSGLSFTPN